MSKLSIGEVVRGHARAARVRGAGKEWESQGGESSSFLRPSLARSHVLSCLASLAVNGELASRLMLEVKYEMPAKAWLLEA